MAELNELEHAGGLGVEFVEVKKGDRICEWVAYVADGSDLV